MINTVGEPNSGKITISESVFRFGAEVRAGDDPLEAQLRLIRDGEAATPQSLQAEKVALKRDTESTENDADVEDEFVEEEQE